MSTEDRPMQRRAAGVVSVRGVYSMRIRNINKIDAFWIALPLNGAPL